MSILLIGYLALGLLLGGVYFLLSELSQYVIIWGLLGTLAVAATLTGVRRNRPNVRRPWYLIATGQACFALGDVIKQAAPASLADVGDLFYLISYATSRPRCSGSCGPGPPGATSRPCWTRSRSPPGSGCWCGRSS